jgi:putative membrane protein
VDSEAAIAGLERLVGENRVTIAVVFPLVGAGLMVASARGWLPPILAFNPLVILAGVIVMRLPIAATLAPLLDRRFALGLAAVSLYAYAIEYVGIATGLPYGEFSYGVALGPMLPGGVPLGLPAFFLPLVVNAYVLVALAAGGHWRLARFRLPATVAVVLAIDLVLDPAAVALGLWQYSAAGVYYGVPLSNFAGWILSASVATVLVDASVDRAALRRRLQRCAFALDDLLSFVLLWGAVAVVFVLWVPILITAGFGVALAQLGRLDLTVGDPRDRHAE